MARSNGGIIGKNNKTSFGKNKITSKTSSGNLCTQSGTRVVELNVVAGGGGGGYNVGGGGGAGGFVRTENNVCGSTQYTVTVGGGGAGGDDSAPRNGTFRRIKNKSRSNRFYIRYTSSRRKSCCCR